MNIITVISDWVKNLFNKSDGRLPPFPNPTPDIIPPSPPEPSYDSINNELLAFHNDFRTDKDKRMLVLNPKLILAAQKHAQWMSNNRRMSHYGASFSNHSQRIKNEGYIFISTAENIAWGQKNCEEVFNAWVNSRGHRNNILSNNNECGFGMVNNYWCAVFASKRS